MAPSARLFVIAGHPPTLKIGAIPIWVICIPVSFAFALGALFFGIISGVAAAASLGTISGISALVGVFLIIHQVCPEQVSKFILGIRQGFAAAYKWLGVIAQDIKEKEQRRETDRKTQREETRKKQEAKRRAEMNKRIGQVQPIQDMSSFGHNIV